MASTSNILAGTGENNAGIGATAWTNPSNITSNNAADATCAAAGSSQYLVARNFNFNGDFTAIPAGSIIVGVTLRVEASEHSGGTESLNAQLQDDTGALIGLSKSATINGTGKAVYIYGGTSDLWGATTITRAMVTDADFGARLWFTTSHDVRIDFVSMALEYVTPASGSLAVTESGSDTLAATGTVLVDGTLDATESGPDTAAITGQTTEPTVKPRRRWSNDARGQGTSESQNVSSSTPLTGTLAATEGSDTAEFTGDVIFSGSLAATEGASDTAALAGDVLVDGELAATESGGDTASFLTAAGVRTGGLYYASSRGGIVAWRQSAAQVISGTVAAVETDADTAAVAGDVLVQGSLAATETGDDTASFTPLGAVEGSLAASETGSDTAAFTAVLSASGTVAAVETGEDTAALAGDVYITGTLAATDDLDSASIRYIDVLPTRNTGAGKSRRRKKYTVEIDGEAFAVNSKEEAVALLEQAREVAEETARLAVERAAKAELRPTRRVLADARKTLKQPAIAAEGLEAEAKALAQDIESIYRDAMVKVEIAALMRREEEDEEEALLLLL